jgi:hypothetical protein
MSRRGDLLQLGRLRTSRPAASESRCLSAELKAQPSRGQLGIAVHRDARRAASGDDAPGVGRQTWSKLTHQCEKWRQWAAHEKLEFGFARFTTALWSGFHPDGKECPAGAHQSGYSETLFGPATQSYVVSRPHCGQCPSTLYSELNKSAPTTHDSASKAKTA